MNCDDFQARLARIIETRTTTVPDELREHADVCRSCHSEWETWKRLKRAIAAWTRRIPHVDVTDAVFTAMAAERSRDNRKQPTVAAGSAVEVSLTSERRLAVAQPRSSWPVVVAAACIAMLVMTNVLVNHGKRSTNRLATEQPSGIEPSISERPAMDSVVRDTGAAWLDLAREAADAVVDAGMLIPERALPITTPLSAGELTDTWTERLETGIGPLGTRVARAFDFLFDAVPEPQSSTL